MDELTFEGEVTALSEIQQEFIKNILKEQGINHGKVQILTVGQPGDNYVANVKRIVAEKDGKTFKIIVKIAPKHETLRQTMNTGVIFLNEHIMYTEVLPKITELEISANIPAKDRLRYAKCYGTIMDEPNELVVLEDLAVSDFVMLHRYISLKDDSIKLVLKNFAKLHSASYALKQLEPETFNKFSTKLRNMWEIFSSVPNMDVYMKELCSGIMNLMDDDKYLNIIDEVMSDMLKEAVASYNADKGASYSVIQQGDPWTNNILFKLEGENSTDCCMIDYQISKESSPVADIMYMVFNCTDYTTRDKHYHQWIDYYHSELANHLKPYGLEIEATYPRSQLDADLKRYARLGLAQSIMLASMLMRETKDAAKFKEAMESGKTMEEMMESTKLSACDETSLTRLKEKVVGLIDSFLDLGYIE